MLRILTRWLSRDSDSKEVDADAASRPKKWMPIIATDSCTGCGQCVEACEHGCLGMEWSFATLQQPGDCDSEGRCAEACPHDVIQMGWGTAAGNRTVGRWQKPDDSKTEK